jgi:hypothetical protein
MAEVTVHNMPSVYVMETEMPISMVNDLNDYLDEYREDQDKKSLADTLVGQIAQGEQLLMNNDDSRVKEYSEFVCSLGADYINFFFNNTGSSLKNPKAVTVDETWSVHSYAGDYNPIHDHGTKTIMGISTTGWTKVPEQILNQPTAGSPQYSLYQSSGEGERRTVASNLNCWDVPEESLIKGEENDVD